MSYRRVWRGNLREIDHLKDPGLDGRIILKWMCYYWDGGMDWFDTAQDRDMWRAVVNAEMNFGFHNIWGIS